MPRRDDARLLDMLIAARKARDFASGVTLPQFTTDEVLQYAVMHALQVVGEAASRVADETRAQNPEVPWRLIVGMRNRLVHDYLTIDIERVWAVIEQELPPLIAQLETIVPPDRA